MSEERRLQTCLEAILDNLALIDSLSYEGEEARQEAQALLDDFKDYAVQVQDFYTNKYKLAEQD